MQQKRREVEAWATGAEARPLSDSLEQHAEEGHSGPSYKEEDMPLITNADLLPPVTVGVNTTLEVKYNAAFTAFERHLAGLGMRYLERITVQGVDGATATDLTSFPSQFIPVTDGATGQVIPRDRSATVARAILQEDPPGDDDELRCRIEIVPVGFPQSVAGATDTEIVVG